MPSSFYVVFDLETTGLSPKAGERVIEIGAVAIRGGEVSEEFHSLVRTGRRIHPRAADVHGISEEMLEGHPAAEEVIPAFRDFIGDAVLVAHNAGFDMPFLRNEFSLQGFGLENRFRCTLTASRKHHPELPNHRLPTVYSHLVGALPRDARLHRALDDARLCASVWQRLLPVAGI